MHTLLSLGARETNVFFPDLLAPDPFKPSLSSSLSFPTYPLSAPLPYSWSVCESLWPHHHGVRLLQAQNQGAMLCPITASSTGHPPFDCLLAAMPWLGYSRPLDSSMSKAGARGWATLLLPASLISWEHQAGESPGSASHNGDIYGNFLWGWLGIRCGGVPRQQLVVGWGVGPVCTLTL